MRDSLLFERAASCSNNTAPGGLHVLEHCPISILQAHGGGAIPRRRVWTTERFVRFLSTLAVDLPVVCVCVCVCVFVLYCNTPENELSVNWGSPRPRAASLTIKKGGFAFYYL